MLRRRQRQSLQRGPAVENSAMKTTANAVVSLVIVCQAGKHCDSQLLYIILSICFSLFASFLMIISFSFPFDSICVKHFSRIIFFFYSTFSFDRWICLFQLWQKSFRSKSTRCFPVQGNSIRTTGENGRLRQIERSC